MKHDTHRPTRIALKWALVPFLVACGVTGTSAANDNTAAPDPGSASITDLTNRIDDLTALVASQQSQIQQMSADSSEQWMSEHRAEELRAITADVLADADLRSSMLQSGATAGHDGGAFFIGSADGEFLMHFNGLLQFRWVGTFRGEETGRSSTSPDDDSEMGFEFRRVELVFGGNIHDIGYTLVLATEDGAAGVEQIIAQDIKIEYALTDNWTIAGGRYFAPFLREELLGGGGSVAVALSYMNNNLSVGRGEGVSAIYQGDSFRGHVFFSDGAGSGGGGGVNNTTADASDFAVTARGDFMISGDWNQWGDFTADGGETAIFLGAAVHVQQGESGDSVAANDTDLVMWTVDGSVQWEKLHLFASLAGNSTETGAGSDLDDYGGVVQLGYKTEKWEPFARYEYLSFDDARGYVDDSVSLITVGANYHYNDQLKLGLDVVWALDSIPTDSLNAGLLADGVDEDQVVVRAQAQLKF